MSSVEYRKKRYRAVKAAKPGDKVQCPGCLLPFVKKSKKHTFCGRLGKRRCNDAYWNAVDPRKSESDKHRMTEARRAYLDQAEETQLHDDAMALSEAGWDGHKSWTGG